MARGAAKTRPKRAKPDAKRRHQGTPSSASVEQQLFFTRLRKTQKPIFIFLALVFGLGFVFFGVGSGSTGIADALGNFSHIFGGGSSTNSALSKAKDRVKKHPNDPAALKALADAYRTDGKDADATKTLERYVKLRPRNADALLQIGSYYGNQGASIGGQWQDARAQASNQSPLFQPGGTAPTGTLGQALTQDPVGQALNQQVEQLRRRSLAAFKKAETAFRHYAGLRKRDQFAQLQVADSARDAYILGGVKSDRDVALFYYERAIKLGPKTQEAKRAKQAIAFLSLGLTH
jgi:tetratricopeptide (TPR) repeat protein